ncbi:MAG TPA: hypothetical protein VJX68_02260 [Candidatus Binatus sp.]|uniref:hypothetical protein n=1 Tax=Candidatus Binatus sp. TaxID=2811406 RepID=UPI002B46F834|nr:hypothetical protein [Candidatus Binatus sp.]HKN11992.1 hypothetical protein [Candidatus Binatus sp.]
MSSAAALAIVEKFAPIIADAMAPEVAALFKSLPSGLVTSAPNSDVEVAVAANVARAMPAVTAAMFATIKNKIGIAVAIYATEHPDDSLQSDAAWMDIQSMAQAGIDAEGLDASQIAVSTIRQMVASGIELYRAGIGTRALTVR